MRTSTVGHPFTGRSSALFPSTLLLCPLQVQSAEQSRTGPCQADWERRATSWPIWSDAPPPSRWMAGVESASQLRTAKVNVIEQMCVCIQEDGPSHWWEWGMFATHVYHFPISKTWIEVYTHRMKMVRVSDVILCMAERETLLLPMMVLSMQSEYCRTRCRHRVWERVLANKDGKRRAVI